MNYPPCFQDSEAKKEIERLCRENNIDILLLKDLCELLNEYSGMGRKEGVIQDIEDIIDRFIKRS